MMAGSKRQLLTPEQERWVTERYTDATNAELVEEMRREFGVSLTKMQLSAYATRNGLRKSKATMHKTRVACADDHRVFTDEMYDFMREYVPGHVYPQTADEFERRFGWKPTRTQYRNLCCRLKIKSGVHDYGRFQKGQIPQNKGKTWNEYISPEAQRRVREAGNLFKKGNRPQNAFHELLDTQKRDDGVTYIYVKPRNAKNTTRLWIPLAQFEWMMHNGRDFPENCKCVHCNHDQSDNSPENLMAVPLDVYGIVVGNFNGVGLDYWDRDSLKLAILHAKLMMTRREKEKTRPRVCTVCGKKFVPGKDRWNWAERVRICDTCSEQGLRPKRRKKCKET